MKRSESILVWAVTAIVGIIVLVAVVFGREGNDAKAGGNGKQGVQELLAGGDSGAFTDAKTDSKIESGDPKTQPQPGGDPKNGGDPAPGAGVTPDPNAALRARTPEVRTLLGEFRLEGQPDGSKYRVVVARFGDSFGEMVQKWTGSTATADEVRALNEGLDPSRLRSGEEVWFPWVDDQILVDAWQARHDRGLDPVRNASVDPSRRPSGELGALANPAPANPKPATPGDAAQGDWRTVRPGETLWKLAADAVGQRRAQAYIDEILRLNPAIQDAGQIKAGDRVLMPRR